MPRREYCFGIYMYTDKETGAVVYIGMDSHIDVHERKNAHARPSSYNAQPFNRALQNNPGRYDYKVYCHADTIEELCQLEFDLINLYRPKFNYKHGGQRGYINPDFEYSVAKNGMSPTSSRQRYVIKDGRRKEIIQSIDREYLEEICQKLNDGDLTPDEIRRQPRRTTNSFESNVKRSKSNASGFYRVGKRTDETCRQGFLWRYEYYDENGKHKHFQRVSLFDLKNEAEKRGLTWHIVDIDKAIATVKSIVAI